MVLKVKEPWWKTGVIYQIYVKSFKDSTGDGIGDLAGIIEKLDYLRRLGVDALWLTPIYVSPQRDNGYDISDYYSIDPDYGTMETFEKLVKTAHSKNLRIILDIVVNHTSTEHPWFKAAASSKENPYRDYYIWREGVGGAAPNNWQSKFGGSAWQFDERTEQYYLHLFDVSQADLNWENPELREHIYAMMDFWLAKGVDGFRLDVINLISKDQTFPDDTLLTPEADGRRFYTDGPRIHEYLQEMNRYVFSKQGEFMAVGEMSSTALENCIKYSNPQERELNMVFSFHHLKVDYCKGDKWEPAELDFLKLKQIVNQWQCGMEEGNGWNALFWCNHDQPRVVFRFGDDKVYHKQSAKMLATVLHLLKGTPFIYQGEEIGMTNAYFERIEEYRDVETLNAYQNLLAKGKSAEEVLSVLQQKSRDNSRTPMQWDTSGNGGFTTGEPWIKTADSYQRINVEQSLHDPDSIYHYYQQLIRLRKAFEVVVHGAFKLLVPGHPQLFAYTRTYKQDVLLVVSNFFGTTAELIISKELQKSGIPQLLLANYPDSKYNVKKLTLRPFESAVFYFKEGDK